MMDELPRIMVAPNGAYLQKSDHPELPITIDEIVDCVEDCIAAGAGGAHLHVRDQSGQHSLDIGLYRELLTSLEHLSSQAYLQITSEAAERYSPHEQEIMIRTLKPRAVSVSLSEMTHDGDIERFRKFYHDTHEMGIAIQHILYSPDELNQFLAMQKNAIIPKAKPQMLFVLGRYSSNQQSKPSDLDAFTNILEQSHADTDWAVCAFGHQETNCLLYALKNGGKARIGFENSRFNANGNVAKNNAERVTKLVELSKSTA